MRLPPSAASPGALTITAGLITTTTTPFYFIYNNAAGTFINQLPDPFGSGSLYTAISPPAQLAVTAEGAVQNGASVAVLTNTYVLNVLITNGAGSTVKSFVYTADRAFPINRVAPNLQGVFVSGQTISINTGTWDGPPAVYLTSLFYASGAPVPGFVPNALSYVLTDTDAAQNQGIYATVNATSPAGRTGTAVNTPVSVAVTAATSNSAPVNTAKPTFSGSFVVGQVITVVPGSYVATPPASLSWVIKVAGATVATTQSYTIVSGDVGKTMTVDETANNGISPNAVTTSDPSPTITAGVPAGTPANSVAPAISGTAAEGQMLTATFGTWSNSPWVYYGVWTSDGVPIASTACIHPWNTLNSTYVQTAEDASGAHVIRFQVAARNASGRSLTVTSSNSKTPTAAASFSLTQFPAGSLVVFDVETGVTAAAGRISQWDSVTGSACFVSTNLAQATAGLQPTLTTAGWDGTINSITLNAGNSSSNQLINASPPLFDRPIEIIVARRSMTDQVAISTSKSLYNGSIATGPQSYGWSVSRTSVDPAQSLISGSGIGGGAAASLGSGFGKGLPKVLTSVIINTSIIRRVGSSAPITLSTTATGSTISAGAISIGTATANAGIRADIVYILRADANAFRASYPQSPALAHIIEGYISWGKYNNAAADLAGGTVTLSSQLPVGHPYQTRAPTAADYTNGIIDQYILGNSLTNGWGSGIGGAANLGNLGGLLFNGGTGGFTAGQCNEQYDAQSIETRTRVIVVGDIFTNGAGTYNGVATTSFDCIARMVAETESLQGVSTGQGRIVILDHWRTVGNPATPGVTGMDGFSADNNALRTLYPNYFFNVADSLWAMGAPDGPYPDSTWFPQMIRPAVMQTDNIHLTGPGYPSASANIAQFLVSRGFNRT